MSATDVDLGQRRLFLDNMGQNNFVTIAAVVSASIPLANVFNGQNSLVEIIKGMLSKVQTGTSSISFGEIQKLLNFKMYKVAKPKVIFSAYISRVNSDVGQTNIQSSQYLPSIQFKIDYDACCVGSMVAMLTIDLQVRKTLSKINVNGFTANGNVGGIQIQKDDIYSIQYAYGPDFIYHWIDKCTISFANTGGSAPQLHQDVPSEIIKIYHSLLEHSGVSQTIKRAVREDQFVINHNPRRQYGDFTFQIKSPASIPANTSTKVNGGNNGLTFGFNQAVPTSQQDFLTSNELAMYYTNTYISDIGFGGVSNSNSYSNPSSVQCSFADPTNTGNTCNIITQAGDSGQKIITGIDINTQLYWRLGSSSSVISLVKGTGSDQTTINFQGQMSYIPLVSTSMLPQLFSGLTPSSQYPKYQNGKETLYLVPYVQYDVDVMNFTVAVVSKLDTGYYSYTGSVLGTTGSTVSPVFKDSFQIIIQDTTTNNGKMVYNYGVQTLVNQPSTLIMRSTYGLSVSSTDGFQTKAVVQEFLQQVSTTLTTLVGTGAIISEDVLGYTNCIISSTQSQQQVSLTNFQKLSAQQMGAYLLKTTGALSPQMQQANISYVNLEYKPYKANDLSLNSMDWYMNSNGVSLDPRGADKMAVFKYNAATAANARSEENHPCIQNIDDLSIHTYRENHGIVDFYIPLQFLFICQDISQSFPHYACAAQSIIVKFEFCNPFAFINTSISVNPQAMDPLDFSRKERILVNRVLTREVLISNVSNMRGVLFYTRYAWVPQLIPILAGYKYYSWITNNYERYYKIVISPSTNQSIVLGEFNKSNFYTRIWTFITNRETIDVAYNKGAQQEYIPNYVNKFNLEIWDKTRFGINTNSNVPGANIGGTDSQNLIAQQNSVYFQVPIEDVQLKTKTGIQMMDVMPFRAQMLLPYLMLEHQGNHSALPFNNLLMFHIDPVFYQEGFPYAMYSPAFAPDFELRAQTKSGQQQDFGAIIIPEFKNVSFISAHIILVKFSTNQ